MPNYTPNYNLAKPLVNDPVDEDLWGGYLNADMDTIDTQMKTNADAITALITVPIGCILDYAGAGTVPTNYLYCYGQAVSRATYASLFTAIGTNWGVGDGTTTFNLPDLRGRVTAGKDDMGGTSANRLTGLTGGVNGDNLAAAGGEESHILTTAEISAHTHTEDNLTLIDPVQAGAGAYKAFRVAGGGAETETTASTGGDGAHNNVQPTAITTKIIRAL